MRSLMSLNRFEAFSDGVFAIAMTLLVIEIKIFIPLFYLFPSVIDQQLVNLPDASFQSASDAQSTSRENR